MGRARVRDGVRRLPGLARRIQGQHVAHLLALFLVLQHWVRRCVALLPLLLLLLLMLLLLLLLQLLQLCSERVCVSLPSTNVMCRCGFRLCCGQACVRQPLRARRHLRGLHSWLGACVGRLGEAGAPLKPRIDSEMANHLGYVEASLVGRDWLMGDFSAADIQMSFVGEVTGAFGQFGTYPNIKAWVDRFQTRPAYKRALEKGGAYNMDFQK